MAARQLRLDTQLTNVSAALDWLETALATAYRGLQSGELALGLHALASYPEANRRRRYSGAIGDAENWLIRQSIVSPVSWSDYLVSYEAPTLASGASSDEDEYFVMPSSTLMLTHFLLHRPFHFMRPTVLRRARDVVDNVLEHKVYVSPHNLRASTRENQFAFDWCHAIVVQANERRLSLTLLGYLAALTTIVTWRTLVLTLLIFLALYPIAQTSTTVFLGTIAISFMSSVLANVLTNR